MKWESVREDRNPRRSFRPNGRMLEMNVYKLLLRLLFTVDRGTRRRKQWVEMASAEF
eukprot:c34359_g1_i1 orf=209-379(+)